MPKSNDQLRKHIVGLAGARIALYYHPETNTHIIMQLPGTELGPFALKGYGDFADDAKQDFNHTTEATVVEMDRAQLEKHYEVLQHIKAEVRNMRPKPH